MSRNNAFVTLVGAGPGDAGLLTLAGREALLAADVVLFDRLVGPGVLALIPATAERIDVGKVKGRHPVPQEEINRLLVDKAHNGRRVVRLKGGDPYLFGRGAEELDGLNEAGIPYRVIPGVTSALAAPACAGIPVTHRDASSSVHIITGHAKDGAAPVIPYPELARLGGTLVFLMGVTALAAITEGLLAAGMPAATPAALIENGSRWNQRRLTATLAGIAARAAAENIASPAVLVVGQVCRLAERYDWTRTLPLHGKCFLAASSRTTASRLGDMLRRLGAEVDEFQAITLVPVRQPDDFWPTLAACRCLAFTSEYGVETFFAGLRDSGRDVRAVAHAVFAAVGARTAEALAGHGITADIVPERHDAGALAAALAGALRRDGGGVLLFRARDGSAVLPEMLRGNAIPFRDVAAYDTLRNTLDAETSARLLAGGYAGVTFTSASTVEAVAASCPAGSLSAVTALCIGGVTAAKAATFGMRTATSPAASLEAMAEFIAALHRERKQS